MGEGSQHWQVIALVGVFLTILIAFLEIHEEFRAIAHEFADSEAAHGAAG